MRRALVVGGTGKLSGVVGELVRDGWYVVTPSRRDASPAAAARGFFHTEDFIEGREAEAAGRSPVYQGK